MPAKRRTPKKRSNAITPRAVEAFHARDRVGLSRALGLKPWEANPLDVEPSDALGSPGPWRQSVPKALDLRKQLSAAAGKEDA